jgi:hypothetical protein
VLAGRLYWRLAVVRQRVNDEGLVQMAELIMGALTHAS